MFPTSSDSPFLVLWYFYLLFVAAVVILQLFFLCCSKLIKWRLHVLVNTKPKPARRKKAKQA